MSNNSGTEATANLDSSRFVTEKVSEEGGVISGSTGGSPALKHSTVGGGGSGSGVECGGSDKPQATTTTTTTGTASTITTNRGGVPDGNCSAGGAPEKGKKGYSSVQNRVTIIITNLRVIMLISVC
jgi:hypothetical protein